MPERFKDLNRETHSVRIKYELEAKGNRERREKDEETGRQREILKEGERGRRNKKINEAAEKEKWIECNE